MVRVQMEGKYAKCDGIFIKNGMEYQKTKEPFSKTILFRGSLTRTENTGIHFSEPFFIECRPTK